MLDDNLESISVLRGYYPEHVDPFSKEKPSLGLWATTISSEMPAEWNRSVWNFSTSDRASLPLGTEPDLFFISCYSGLLKTCLNCIEWIRDSLPDALIIVGGAHATFSPKSFDCSPPDLIWQGEVDGNVMFAIEVAMANKKVGKVSSQYSNCHNLNLTTPDWEFYASYSDYVDLAMPRMLLSRDCPNRCAFCTPRGNRKKIIARRRSLDSFVSEVAKYRSITGDIPLHIRFSDPDFLWDTAWAKEVLNVLGNLNLSWDCQTRVPNNDSMLLKLIPKMKECGCRSLFLGVESLDKAVLTTINKNYPVENVANILNSCTETGIMPLCNLIVGLPGQTKDSALSDVAWACENLIQGSLGCVDLQFLQLMPGTPISINPRMYSINPDDSFSWELIDSVVQHDTAEMSRECIQQTYNMGIERLNQVYSFLTTTC